jgi:hypothetical protein
MSKCPPREDGETCVSSKRKGDCGVCFGDAAAGALAEIVAKKLVNKNMRDGSDMKSNILHLKASGSGRLFELVFLQTLGFGIY